MKPKINIGRVTSPLTPDLLSESYQNEDEAYTIKVS
jgi:hypothetical protein